MTAEEIKQATPEQLRVGVALVLGWNTDGTFWFTPDMTMTMIGDVPYWPTDDQDAVTLLAEMTRRGWWWACSVWAKAGHACHVRESATIIADRDGEKWRVMWQSESDSLATAICRAFLLADLASKGNP